ncbi:hypothetical protein QYF61_017378 [Mycteria americana]|uniref:Uncharacterized protein n=1 Tax=Mycteria americana TaxID=33587 RepID=A0AAN7N8N0_MYCAM|nr:hypothetical protein QYF61_017378 [Mycteria americana]
MTFKEWVPSGWEPTGFVECLDSPGGQVERVTNQEGSQQVQGRDPSPLFDICKVAPGELGPVLGSLVRDTDILNWIHRWATKMIKWLENMLYHDSLRERLCSVFIGVCSFLRSIFCLRLVLPPPKGKVQNNLRRAEEFLEYPWSSLTHGKGQTKPDLIAFYGETSGCVDKGKAVRVVYLGFSKVVDRVSHKIFLAKLERQGLGNGIRWAGNGLENWAQGVVIGGIKSNQLDWWPVTSGIGTGDLNNRTEYTLSKFVNNIKLGCALICCRAGLLSQGTTTVLRNGPKETS